MNFHELKDIVMIYSSDQHGQPSYEWDKAQIKVWNPLEQREMDLVFVGSSKGDALQNHIINFNSNFIGTKGLPDEAFSNAIKKIFPNIEERTLEEYKKVFLEEMIKLKK